MKAVRFHEYGDADVLRYEDVEQPVPGAGEVRLRVAATSFNPVDGGIRGGYLQGTVPGDAAAHARHRRRRHRRRRSATASRAVAVGDEVVGFLSMIADGAAAEYVIAPAEILAPAPTSIPLADAAALPMVGLTAWQALFDDAELTRGQRVLDQRRGRRGRRLRGAAGQARRRARDRHRQPAQQRARPRPRAPTRSSTTPPPPSPTP